MSKNFGAMPHTEAAPIYRPRVEQAAAGVKQPANHPFLLFAHPMQWHVMNGKLVPQLSSKSLDPGLSNVDKSGDAKGMIASMQDRSYVLIPQDYGGGNYVARTQTTSGGYWHHTPWMSGLPGSDIIRVDEDGYTEWCESLVGDLIPPIPIELLEQMIEQAQRDLSEAIGKARANPHFETHAENAKARLDVLEAARAPKPARRSRKAKTEEAADAE